MPKLLTALCLLVLLSACGQTGALYLPDHGKPPARHKDKEAKLVPVKPALAAAPGATQPELAPTPAADDSTQSTPSP